MIHFAHSRKDAKSKSRTAAIAKGVQTAFSFAPLSLCAITCFITWLVVATGQGSPALSEGAAPGAVLAADIPLPPMGEIGRTMWVLAGIVVIAGMLLKTWNEGRKAFARTPPYSEELANIRAQVIPRAEIESTFHRIDQDVHALRKRVDEFSGLLEMAKGEILAAGDKRLARIELRLDLIADTSARSAAAIEQMNREHYAPKK
jgi:hypothetical protein